MGAAPRYARPFVAIFVGMVVFCALAPLNLWPFSNWELFSRLRRGRIQDVARGELSAAVLQRVLGHALQN